MDPKDFDNISGVSAQAVALLARIPIFKRVKDCLIFYGDEEPDRFYLSVRSILADSRIDSFGPYKKPSKFINEPNINHTEILDELLKKNNKKYDLMLFCSKSIDVKFISLLKPAVDTFLGVDGITIFASKKTSIEGGIKIFDNPRYKIITKALPMTESFYPLAYKILNILKKY